MNMERGRRINDFSVVYNYCIWMCGIVSYSNDCYGYRYNWIHSASGAKAHTGIIYKYPDLLELAIL